MENLDISEIPDMFRAFYEEDGMIADTQRDRLEIRLHKMSFIFGNFGLEFNSLKLNGCIALLNLRGTDGI